MTDSDTLFLDACCILNLAASDHFEDVLASVGARVAVAEAARRESLYLLSDSSESGENELVVLDPLIASGLLQIVAPESDAERSSYVAFAAQLDDGEAMTCALAFHRNGAVATDDRKAIRTLGDVAPHVRVVTTAELLHAWAGSSGVSEAELRASLMRIERRARFRPSRSDRFHEWWRSLLP